MLVGFVFQLLLFGIITFKDVISVSDKEIALELTKSYLEHLNVRINNKAMHSQTSAENTSKIYQHFYDVIAQLDNSDQ